MATEIDIENTALRTDDIKKILEARSQVGHTITTYTNGTPKCFADFCIVLIGDKPKDFDAIMSIKPSDLIFKCPGHFTQAHIAAALGAFKSVTAARKNGWDKEVEQGLSEMNLRINRIKGIVSVWKS